MNVEWNARPVNEKLQKKAEVLPWGYAGKGCDGR